MVNAPDPYGMAGSNYQPGSLQYDLDQLSPTRRGAYSFGGADATLAAFGAGNNYAVRQCFTIGQKWSRLRFRFRNYVGWNDGGTAVGQVTIGNVYLGREPIGAPNTFAQAPELVSAGGAANGGTIGGTTEFVTPWFTPQDTAMQKLAQPLLLSFQLQNNTGSAIVVAQTNGGRAWANSAGSTVAQLAATGYSDNGAGLWPEIIAEYDFTPSALGTRVGLFVGPSYVDAHDQASTAGWLGQDTGFPQLWAKRTGGIAVVNAYGNTQGSDWGPASQKWARFPGVVPDFIFLSLIGNDIITGGINLATAQARYQTLLGTVHSLYPNVPVYVALEPPYNATATPDGVRTTFNTWLAQTKGPLGITGLVDFDRAIRDTTTLANVHADFNGGDNVHPTPRGYEKLADALTFR